MGVTQVEEAVGVYTWFDSVISSQHTWSPDGSLIAYKIQDPTNDTAYNIFVRDLISGQEQQLQLRAAANGSSHWSSQGEIAISDGNVRVYDPATGGLKRVVLQADTRNSYRLARWSPDGNHLVFQHLALKSGLVSGYSIDRIAAGGGTITSLTTDLSASLGKSPQGWVSDNIAAGP